MIYKDELLKDNYSFEQAEKVQVKYQKIIQNSTHNTIVKSIQSIETVVGVDVAYFTKDNAEFGIAAAVLWNVHQERVEFECGFKGSINFPYKAGFLGFRECKLLAQPILNLPFKPNLIMCDGHGKIHPRRFGEAVQLGLALGIPSIGVAKNPYVGDYKLKDFKRCKGYKTPIWGKNQNFDSINTINELLGYAVCLNNGSKPVYISEGYNILIDVALEICLATTKGHRQPEPLYLADQLSKTKIKKCSQELK